MSSERLRYSVTTCEPGASEVFTQGFTMRPFARALRARSPAPSITAGFEVLVQLVIAAMTTAPLSSWKVSSCPSRLKCTGADVLASAGEVRTDGLFHLLVGGFRIA